MNGHVTAQCEESGGGGKEVETENERDWDGHTSVLAIESRPVAQMTGTVHRITLALTTIWLALPPHLSLSLSRSAVLF